jgi:hypothetical protein
MFDNFKMIMKAAELIGTIEKMTMYESYASIDLVDKDGKSVSITIAVTEVLKNETV